MRTPSRLAIAMAATLALAGIAPAAAAAQFSWTTVVNNGNDMPPCPDPLAPAVKFNSYSQPSINEAGLAVFRGRSMGGAEPSRGVYQRDMGAGSPVSAVACVNGTVPDPNNILYNGVPAPFNEFPSLPRIDALSATIATRGQSQPVWEYQVGVDPTTGEPTTTRVGTSGIYANPGGTLVTGASLLGAVVTYPATDATFPQYSVPGFTPPLRFDQFPGSGAVSSGSVIAFKGNFTTPDLIGRTGVFFRDVSAASNPTYLVASSATTPVPGSAIMFGSTAPPSTAAGYLYFVGSDIEEAPTVGGIYRALMTPADAQNLETLVAIGQQVPGEAAGVGFTMFGEGLSLTSDGRFMTFWAKWGTATFPKTLYCPPDGEAAVLAYCNAQYPDGYTASIPADQGIFVYDTVAGTLTAVAKSGEEGMEDFLFWVFSGAPPGVGGGEEESTEPPRWRSSGFAAVSTNGTDALVAFKAVQDGVMGIFLRPGGNPLVTVARQFESALPIDASAPANSIVTTLGLEREGFRGTNLAINVGMLYETVEESLGWAGIYVTQVQGAPTSVALAAPPGPSLLGTSLSFTGTVAGSGATGTLTFVSNGAPIAGCIGVPLVGGSASCTTALPFGMNVITADYSGDAAYMQASSLRSYHAVLMPVDKRFTAFGGDATADLAWRLAGGGHSLWNMLGLAYADAPASAGAGMSLVRLADFNGDANTDLLWRGTDNRYVIQLLVGTDVADQAQVLGGGTGWQVVQKGDFDGDGNHDLLWRHLNGSYGTWLMDGTAASSYAGLASPGFGYSVALVADFNGDGRSDILWRHTNGSVSMSIMNGHDAISTVEMLGPDTGWTPVLAGDLDANGRADLMWRHANGAFGVWIVDGTTMLQYASLLGPGTGWTPTLTADFNGDGKSDIVWSHVNGSQGGWLMDGVNVTAYAAFSPSRTGWTIVAAADHDGDGKTDVLWRHTDGRHRISLVDGLALTATGELPAALGATMVP